MEKEKRLINADAFGSFLLGKMGFNPASAEMVLQWMDEYTKKNTVDAVELPCKVGHTVFFVDTECDENGKETLGISVGKVHSFSIQSDGLWAYCRYESGLTYWHKVNKDFGKTVFITETEALAKMDGGNEDV